MKPRLLIVDDSRVSRMMIQAKIASLGLDWELEQASNGEQALQVAARWVPDFVTMDVNMPGPSGFDTALQLHSRYPQTRIVMLTANVQDSSRNQAQQLGLHFIAKPVTEAAIEQAVSFFRSDSCKP